MVLNLLLLAAESLPGGGTIALAGSPRTATAGHHPGPRAAWPAGLLPLARRAARPGEAMLADPRRLQAPLTALLARGLWLPAVAC